MKMKTKEKEAYKNFRDRVAMPGKPRKLTGGIFNKRYN